MSKVHTLCQQNAHTLGFTNIYDLLGIGILFSPIFMKASGTNGEITASTHFESGLTAYKL
jgi:hypothetical protein